MQTRVETVTPEIAETWLSANTQNRPLKNSTVDSYAADMRAGRWELNGSTIVFGNDGRLIDGQHRLRACVRAEVPFQTVIVEGVRNGVELTIDGGTKRNSSDHLAFRGEENTAVLAALARTAYCYDYRKGRMAGVRVSARDVIEYVENNPRIRESTKIVSGFKSKKNSSPSLIGAGTIHFFACSRMGRDDLAIRFVEGIATGAELREGDPRLAFRNRMLSREFIGPDRRFWAACATWNAWIAGGTKDRLFLPTEPVILNPAPSLSVAA